jgi:predicted small lipoprotein YifL
MNYLNEFALLFAVATPLVVLFSMNVFLMLEGERGTLMLPSSDWSSPEGVADEQKRSENPANDEHFRRAA